MTQKITVVFTEPVSAGAIARLPANTDASAESIASGREYIRAEVVRHRPVRAASLDGDAWIVSGPALTENEAFESIEVKEYEVRKIATGELVGKSEEKPLAEKILSSWNWEQTVCELTEVLSAKRQPRSI